MDGGSASTLGLRGACASLFFATLQSSVFFSHEGRQFFLVPGFRCLSLGVVLLYLCQPRVAVLFDRCRKKEERPRPIRVQVYLLLDSIYLRRTNPFYEPVLPPLI